MQNTEIHTLILGAGLTGLSLAHFLKKQGLKALILEKNSTAGGVIQTHRKNGFVYETGPNTGVLGSAEIAELFEDLKPYCELELGSENVSKRYILKHRKWEPLPSGFFEAIKTPLFTFKDKLRLLGEPFRGKGKDPHETLSDLVLRRMGASFLDYAIDPFILGVYAGDPNLLVPKYALPKLYDLEQNYGSFIGGAFKKKLEKKSEREKKANRKVFSVKGGLTNLVNALCHSVGEGAISLSVHDISVRQINKIYLINYKLGDEVFSVKAQNVVFTGTAEDMASNSIFSFLQNDKRLQNITNLQYAPVAEVSLGFKKWKGRPLDGFGGLIPFKENRDILGVLFMSSLFENRAPKEGALLTVFMGGIRKPHLACLSDDETIEIMQKEICQLFDVEVFNPDLIHIQKYSSAIPQYAANSGLRFDTIDEIQRQYPGLYLAGNMRDGIGMADRAKQASLIANQIAGSK